MDGSGNLFIADLDNNRIREVNASTHVITTVVGDGNGNYNGDNIPATDAELYFPTGVTVDGSGNLFIADSYNNRIREVNASTQIITTVVGDGNANYNGDNIPATDAELNYPTGVAVDGSGNLFIADLDNSRIREVNAGTQVITTVVGDGNANYNGDNIPATDAELAYPFGVTVDGSGNLFIADYYNNRIREVNAGTEVITTVAGNGTANYNGDNIQATDAELQYPEGVAVDGAGNLFIADSYNNRIREVSAGTQIITTIAGNAVASSTDHSSFTTPMSIPNVDLGLGHGLNNQGGQAVTVEGSISTGQDPVRYPGGPDQPGEREIPANAITDGGEGSNDDHVGIGSGSVITLTYYFPPSLPGVDSNGNPTTYPNTITPAQENDVRLAFDVYAHEVGCQVEESTSGGIPIFMGDPCHWIARQLSGPGEQLHLVQQQRLSERPHYRRGRWVLRRGAARDRP